MVKYDRVKGTEFLPKIQVAKIWGFSFQSLQPKLSSFRKIKFKVSRVFYNYN